MDINQRYCAGFYKNKDSEHWSLLRQILPDKGWYQLYTSMSESELKIRFAILGLFLGEQIEDYGNIKYYNVITQW